jgi:hypothetical protein
MVRMHTSDFDLDVHEGSGAHRGAAPTRPHGPAPKAPPPPMSIEQLLAMQNELMWVLTENLMHHGVRQPHHQLVLDSSYTDFLETHPPLSTEASNLLEADNWLCTTESSFGSCTVLSS